MRTWRRLKAVLLIARNNPRLRWILKAFLGI